MPEFSSSYGIKKLNNDNYEKWKCKLELLFIKDKLWRVITQDPPSPITTAWTEKDNEARATIGLLCEDDQLEYIEGTSTAKEAWEALKTQHQKSSLSTTVNLLRTIFGSRLQEGGDVEKHVNSILEATKRLAICGNGFKDDMVASIILGSMPDSYDPLIMGIGSRADELSTKLVKCKLVDEYKRRKTNRI